jgi:hydrogenase-4 component B
VNLFLISAVLSIVGAALAIIAIRSENTSKHCSCVFGIIASLWALTAGCMGIFSSPDVAILATPFAFAELSILINPLSGLLLVVINLLALAAWIYGFGYLKEYAGREVGVIGFFMNLFIVSMNFLVVADNVFWFLVFFEVMSLASYFLVVVKQDEKSTKAGFLYLVMAHIGFLLIMIAFFIMSSASGSFDFQTFRETDFGTKIASTVFVLTLIGFGCKAGMVPFHSWLPKAHPAAPSHISALMSGGMIKIGIFGIVKVGLDLLGNSGCELWWGICIVLLGAVSSLLGITYALTERDIKSLLAYSSIENIGIMLLGVGAGFIGVAIGQPLIAGLGLMAGLYHLINHAMFKGLLFMGAGSVIFSAHNRDIEKLGGLVKAMPVTALCFLLGSMAVAALPPFNGFVSEWFTYQAMFTAAFQGSVVIRMVFAIAAVALVVTGALAVACFVKAFGVTFLGAARSDAARKAKEAPFSMKLGTIIPALLCIGLGLGAPCVAPVMQGIAASTLWSSHEPIVSGLDIINPELDALVSMPMVAILIVALVGLAFAAIVALGKGGRAANREPWACGYLPDADMPVRGSSFGAQMDMFFRPLFKMRAAITAQSDKFVAFFNGMVKSAAKTEVFGDRYLVDTVGAFVKWISFRTRGIEGGNFRVYVLYIVVALIALLIMTIFL